MSKRKKATKGKKAAGPWVPPGGTVAKATAHLASSNGGYKGSSTGYPPYKGSTAAYSGYVGKTCQHYGQKGVKAGDVTLYPGANRNLQPKTDYIKFDIINPLLPSCSDIKNIAQAVLWFPIVDFSAPDPEALRVHCQRLISFAKAGAKVLFFCEGGHGRTGTVLGTCIALLEPDTDPIEATRTRHCSHAIETQSQIEVVFKAAGREVPTKWKPVVIPKAVTPAEIKGWQGVLGKDLAYGRSVAVPAKIPSNATSTSDSAGTHTPVTNHAGTIVGFNDKPLPMRDEDGWPYDEPYMDNALHPAMGSGGGTIVLPLDKEPEKPLPPPQDFTPGAPIPEPPPPPPPLPLSPLADDDTLYDVEADNTGLPPMDRELGIRPTDVPFEPTHEEDVDEIEDQIEEELEEEDELDIAASAINADAEGGEGEVPGPFFIMWETSDQLWAQNILNMRMADQEILCPICEQVILTATDGRIIDTQIGEYMVHNHCRHWNGNFGYEIQTLLSNRRDLEQLSEANSNAQSPACCVEHEFLTNETAIKNMIWYTDLLARAMYEPTPALRKYLAAEGSRCQRLTDLSPILKNR